MAVNESTEIEARAAEIDEEPEERPPDQRVGFIALVLVLGLAVVLGIVIYIGIRSRVSAQADLKVETEQAAITTVSVIHPTSSAPLLEIALPGNTQAFIDAPIFARTNGYLKKWYFDIGARVKKGQLLAEIETPEVDRQLQQARADLETAQANLDLAKTTATRYQGLVKTGSVSQQDTDNANGDLSAKKASADSMAANVHRLEELQSFEKVYAPFDGVITARSTDIGQLIDAGAASPTGAKELFHMAAINRLRVFVPVPEVYSRAAKTGASVTLTLDEYPGQSFVGTLVRNSNSIDASSRTLLVEVDVDNSRGLLLPGAYVFVHLKLPGQIQSVIVPANTLLFRAEGLRIGVVRDNKAELVPVSIGRDYGNTVEIVSGVTTEDLVIADPPDSLTSGTQVRVTERAQSSSNDQKSAPGQAAPSPATAGQQVPTPAKPQPTTPSSALPSPATGKSAASVRSPRPVVQGASGDHQSNGGAQN